MEYDDTIKQEMANLGIEACHFKTFYDNMRETHQLPSQNIIPNGQYKIVINYLKTNNVLGKNNEILEDGLKSFDNQLESERMNNVHGLLARLKNYETGRQKFIRKFGRQ